MTLNELRYIVAVAQERNFRRAAARCFVSQPALSLAIQKLEEELGVPLFERRKTDIAITPLGIRVIEQAQRVLEEAAKIHAIVHQGKDQLIGPLRLGVIYTVGPYLLPELIPALHEQAPDMPLEVEENLTTNLDGLLRNGRLDVLIVALPFEAPGISIRVLYEEPFTVVVPARHAWAKRTGVLPHELAEEKVLLLPTGHCFSDQVIAACPELSRQGSEALHGNSLETIRNMVASGLGVSVLPCSANSAKYHSKLLKIVPFKEPVPSRRIALAWRKSFAREQVIEVLTGAIQQLPLACVRMLPASAQAEILASR